MFYFYEMHLSVRQRTLHTVYVLQVSACHMVTEWPINVIYPYIKNQQLTSTCFEQAYWSSSESTTLYVQQLVYVMRFCWLAVGRAVTPDDEQ
jgi:hypothetical protein